MPKKWEWMLDENNIEVFEHIKDILKLSRKDFLNRMLTLEADRLLADNIVNDNLLSAWVKKHKNLTET